MALLKSKHVVAKHQISGEGPLHSSLTAVLSFFRERWTKHSHGVSCIPAHGMTLKFIHEVLGDAVDDTSKEYANFSLNLMLAVTKYFDAVVNVEFLHFWLRVSPYVIWFGCWPFFLITVLYGQQLHSNHIAVVLFSLAALVVGSARLYYVRPDQHKKDVMQTEVFSNIAEADIKGLIHCFSEYLDSKADAKLHQEHCKDDGFLFDRYTRSICSHLYLFVYDEPGHWLNSWEIGKLEGFLSKDTWKQNIVSMELQLHPLEVMPFELTYLVEQTTKMLLPQATRIMVMVATALAQEAKHDPRAADPATDHPQAVAGAADSSAAEISSTVLEAM